MLIERLIPQKKKGSKTNCWLIFKTSYVTFFAFSDFASCTKFELNTFKNISSCLK